MRLLRSFFVALLAVTLAACGRQPDTQQLQNDVRQQLAQAFGNDTFKIASLNRMGSATDSTAPSGQTRKVVYYDIELQTLKDVSLGSWDQPSVASLVTVLGAGPRSITGVKTGGNRAGDTIQAHASAIYSQQADKQWVLVAPAGVTPSRAPSFETGADQPIVRTLVKTLDEISNSVVRDGSPAAERIVQQELQRSVTRINGRLARMQNGYGFAGGAEGGEYLAFARALASMHRNDPFRLVPLVTAGGHENIDLLRRGDAVLAIAQADTARLAYNGQGPFAQSGPFTDLRTLGSLYPELVHIVVSATSPIKTVNDLKGKRVALGPPGSAVQTTLLRVLEAHGLQPGTDFTVDAAPFAQALPKLDAGEVDAVVHVIGVPATALRDAFSQAPFRLVALQPDAIAALTGEGSVLLPLAVPAASYPGQPAAVPTVGMPALLLSTSALTRDEAIGVIDAVFSQGQDMLAAGSVQAAQVSAANALRGLSVPLLDGAQEALKSLGSVR
jgi:TRAP transporter TAXI family solute receptor